MCLDPLALAQLRLSEAIERLAQDISSRADDPAVAEAVLARLRSAQDQLAMVQAGYSRREAWRVTMEVAGRVAIEMLLRTLATSNCLPTAHPSIRHDHDPWLYRKKVPPRQWPLPTRARSRGAHLCFVPIAHRARPTRADGRCATAAGSGSQSALRCPTSCRPRHSGQRSRELACQRRPSRPTGISAPSTPHNVRREQPAQAL